MIIKCPYCGRRFELRRRPPQIFCCPKCSFKVEFSKVIVNEGEQQASTSGKTNPGASTEVNKAGVGLPTTVEVGETKVVEGLTGDMKTKLVPGLQQKKQGVVKVTFQGFDYGTITLPYSKSFTLGRKSSDGQAQVKITPDIAMSRVHAGMRTVLTPTGQVVYQITSVKNENPVYVNGMAVPKGKAYSLKSGDVIRMGMTTLVFKLL